MREEKEIREAIDACDRVIDDIDRALANLSSASNWAFFDLLGNGGVSSIAKRSKIRKANTIIASLRPSLENLRKELSDVDMALPISISDTFTDNLFDVFFDNIFTDLRVSGEIKEKIRELSSLRDEIISFRESLIKLS